MFSNETKKGRGNKGRGREELIKLNNVRVGKIIKLVAILYIHPWHFRTMAVKVAEKLLMIPAQPKDVDTKIKEVLATGDKVKSKHKTGKNFKKDTPELKQKSIIISEKIGHKDNSPHR